ncbi:MAG: hypothetical protein WCK47_05845 [bacterium]
MQRVHLRYVGQPYPCEAGSGYKLPHCLRARQHVLGHLGRRIAVELIDAVASFKMADPQMPARLEHAGNLCQRPGMVAEMREDVQADDVVERFVWLVQRVDGFDNKFRLGRQPVLFRAADHLG